MTAAYDAFQEGRRRLRRGMPAQATVPLERARRLEPDKTSIREALGIAYFRLARWDEAEAEFRAVIDLAPPNLDPALLEQATGEMLGARFAERRAEALGRHLVLIEAVAR